MNIAPMQPYRAFSIVSLLYFSLSMLTLIIYKKLVIVQGLGPLPLSIFISPLFFLLSDVITEIYGFKASRNLLYSSLIVLGLVALILPFLVSVSSNLVLAQGMSTLSNVSQSYEIIFADFFKIYLIYLVTILVSDYVNMWAVSRWKVLLKGKYFWIRSVLASLIGLIIYSVLGTGLSPYLLDSALIVKIILIALVLKIIFLIIFAYPLVLVCTLLKRIENLDVYDTVQNYNPFKGFQF